MARGSFVWTDSEVELLLKVALDYKASKAQDNLDWESCQSKYVDMLAHFLELYPSESNEEFPHVQNEITRAHLTTKIKAIRGKYRHSVDTGRRSGHGRVVLLYFELCEQVWGGSPATTTIASGIETNELEDSVPPSPVTSASSLVEVEDAEVDDVDGSVAITPTVKQRRDMLQAKLKGHRHERLKRRLPAEAQWLNAVEDDKNIKKKLVEIIENSEKKASENFSKITNTLDRLTSSIADGFAVLRQVVQTPPPPHYRIPFEGRGPYGPVYAHTPPLHTHSYFPNSAQIQHSFPSNSSADNRPPNAVPLSTVNLTDLTHTPVEGMHGQFSYTQALNED
ncbi:uncharacterized protein LOC130405080 [Gadus chalcogrammus]|uniref:uncharacterized protein LOC130405080 n=1 Tax=Gadus chalcogrammus TaxID=1042646 RepID=UPI0024C4E4B2|nr:uncharacterized protein LOC130405080 [Gadus chalcogrammus]